MALPETVAQGSRNPGANHPAADRAHGRGTVNSMKCPNRLCEHGIEGSPTTCPRCSIPLPGEVLGDRFSLEKIHRVTDYSITYAAFDRERTVDCQVRLYIPRFGRNARELKPEIKALKEMRFEGLPRILDFNWDADFPWVAEEKIAGSSMVGRLVGRDRPLAEPELVGVMLEAARILETLHTLHIYHRDIRPETLYHRDSDNRLMLGTPGWEREFHDKAGAGKKKGNVYTAPEAAAGRASAQADLYSLGVSALHLLTGLNPEGFYNAASRLFQWQRAVKVSPRLAEILDGLLAPAPGDRIQTASRLVQLLQALDREHGTEMHSREAGDGANPERVAPLGSSGKPEGAALPEAAGTGGVAAATLNDGAGSAARGALGGRAVPGKTDAGSQGTGASPSPLAGKETWWGWRRASADEQSRTGSRRLRRIVAAMGAALAALLGVGAAWLRRAWESSLGHSLGAHGAKVLVALGLATGTAVIAKNLHLAPGGHDRDEPGPEATRADAASAHGLPEPVVGFDDQAIPVDPEFQAIVLAHGPLPDPAVLRMWLARQLAARDEAREAANRQLAERQARQARRSAGDGAGIPAGDGFAFSDGSRPEVSRALSLYSSIFPWQGRQVALGSVQTSPRLGEVSAAEWLAASLGLPPSLGAVDTSRHPGPSAGGPTSGKPGESAADSDGTPARKVLAAASEALSALVPRGGARAGEASRPAAVSPGDLVGSGASGPSVRPSGGLEATGEEGAQDRAGTSGRPGDRHPDREGGAPGGRHEASDPGRPAWELAAGSPYDRTAEPGYDPSDSSGLSTPVSPYFIRVNKTYRTLTLYRDGKFAAQFPITIGKGPTTPDGRFTIANKVARPPYEGIPGGDPRNPLGNYWLGLDVSYPGGKAIGLHGTNEPGALGQAQSGGCIRLRNEDVQKLYELVPTGTPVEII